MSEKVLDGFLWHSRLWDEIIEEKDSLVSNLLDKRASYFTDHN